MGSYEAVKVRLDPTPRQERLMVSHAGAARFAYNAGLAHVKEALDNGESPRWSHYDLLRWWNANKDELAVNKITGEAWWSQNSKEAYSMAFRSLAQGFSNWSSPVKANARAAVLGSPSSSRKTMLRGSRIPPTSPPPTASDPYGLKLSRIGRVHCMENVHQRVAGARVVRVSVSQRAGRWYASLTVERESAVPSSVSVTKRGAVGVDLGVKHLATLSDGTIAPNPRALGARLKALRKAQRALSRKIKGSARREKAKVRVAKLHARVADVRADAIHKATAMIAQTYSVVCIEDLNVAGMVKNRCLARSVSDASPGEFRRQLEYKTARTGAVLRVVDRWYPSSKTCSNCGVVKAKLSLSERTFNCDACGTSMDRDLNASINIRVAGSAPETLNARGEDVRRNQHTVGSAVPCEARTKRARQSAVRLGAGLGNEAIQPRVS